MFRSTVGRRLTATPLRYFGGAATSILFGPTTTPMEGTGRIIKVGDFVESMRCFTAEDVALYAKLVGDNNPIHLDPAAAQKAGFPRCIVHGMLVGALFTDAMGRELPGPQSVYLSQTLTFKSPVLVGDELKTTVRVREFQAKKGLIAMDTTVENMSSGKMAVEGMSLGMNRTVRFEGDSPWTIQRPAGK